MALLIKALGAALQLAGVILILFGFASIIMPIGLFATGINRDLSAQKTSLENDPYKPGCLLTDPQCNNIEKGNLLQDLAYAYSKNFYLVLFIGAMMLVIGTLLSVSSKAQKDKPSSLYEKGLR
jgi:hypothetical protein